MLEDLTLKFDKALKKVTGQGRLTEDNIKDTDKELKNEPTFRERASTFASFIGNADLAGYNAIKFDIPLLVEEFLRAEIDFELKGRRQVDVQNIFHKMVSFMISPKQFGLWGGNVPQKI